MTILGIFLLNQIRTGGDRRYIELMELLAKNGNEVFVIINDYLDYESTDFKKIKIPIQYVRHHLPPASFLFKMAIKKYYSEIFSNFNNTDTIDFIHIHGDIHLKSAIYLKKRIKKPFFYASRCNDIDRAHIIRKTGLLSIQAFIYSLLYEVVNRSREKQIAKYADLITIQNIIDKNLFIKRNIFSASKISVIPGNIGLPRCIPVWMNKNKSETVKKILCVGTTSISKGLMILIKVLSSLKKKGYEYIHCTILGSITENTIYHYISRYDVSDMITLEGYVNPFPFYENHDLLFYPSLYDAYPDTVLESLHSGCPVISTSVGGLIDLLQYPELLFNADDIDSITEKIEQCIINKDYYYRIRSLCADRAKIHYFDWAGQFESVMLNYKTNSFNSGHLSILSIYLINEIRTGGDRDYIELLELLAKRGNEVYVLLNNNLNYKPLYITPIYLNIKYRRHWLPPASTIFKYYVRKDICNIINVFRTIPQFIHIHGDIYLKTAILLKKILKNNLFYASRCNDIDRAQILRKYKGYLPDEYLFSLINIPINYFREHLISKYSDLITFLNPSDKLKFETRTNSDCRNISIIPNYIGLPRYMENYKNINSSQSISNVLYIGALSPSKGIIYLIKAAKILKDSGINLNYYILSKIENASYALKLIKRLKLTDNFYIEGYQDPFPYLKKCDLLLYPTLYDGFGNVIIEALHCGCPVIASNSTGPSYILKYDDLLFNIGKSREIAEKIMLCVRDNNYYQKIRNLCNERSGQFQFNWAERFEDTMKDYLINEDAV